MRVAAVQATPVILDAEATVDKAIALLDEAAADGAEARRVPRVLRVALPERRVGGAGRDVGRAAATSCGSGCGRRASTSTVRSSSGWSKACAERGVHLAIGVNEREDDRPGSLYNTLLVIGPEGVLHRHRKLMPTMHERVFHGVGAGDDLGVVDLPGVGRVGGLICWENRMPLARWRGLRGRPADLARAERRRQRRLDRVDAPHRDRGGRVRGERSAVHPRVGVPGRLPARRSRRASTSSVAAAPASCRRAAT